MARRRKRTSITSALLLEAFSILGIVAVAQPTLSLGLLRTVFPQSAVERSANSAHILPAQTEGTSPAIAGQPYITPPPHDIQYAPQFGADRNQIGFVAPSIGFPPPPRVSFQAFPSYHY